MEILPSGEREGSKNLTDKYFERQALHMANFPKIGYIIDGEDSCFQESF